MKNAIAIFSFLLGIAPQIFNLVQTIEAAVVGSGKGQDKLALGVAIVEAGVEMLPPDIKAQLAGSNIIGFTTKVINAAVKVFNAVGVFNK